jgi:hypothetical protein
MSGVSDAVPLLPTLQEGHREPRREVVVRTAIHEDETTFIRRRARSTGTTVALVYNYGGDPEQPWETICETHGGVCSHETRASASSWLSHPEEWCEDCTYGEGALDGTKDIAR